MSKIEEDGKTRVNVRISPEMRQKVEKLAYEMGIGLSTTFVVIMSQYLKGLDAADALSEVARNIRKETMKLTEGGTV